MSSAGPSSDLGVRVDQALGRRGDLRQLEHVAELLRWLVGPLFGLPLKAFADEPGGGALRVIAVLVVAPLLRHRDRPVFMCKVRWPHPSDCGGPQWRINAEGKPWAAASWPARRRAMLCAHVLDVQRFQEV